MNELLFKSSFLLSLSHPELCFRSPLHPSSQISHSFFSSLLSTHRLSQNHPPLFLSSRSARWATSNTTKNDNRKDQNRRVLYPELDQPLKKPKKFDPVANMKKFPDDDFDFDSLRYQKPDEEDPNLDPEELAADEKERQFRSLQKRRARVHSGRLNLDSDITLTKWSESSYGQLLDGLSKEKQNILITKASLLALKNFMKKGEEFVDLKREVYQFGKHRQKDFAFKRNFPHTYFPPTDHVLDYPPPQPEATPIQLKTILADLEGDGPDPEFPLFRLPPTRRLPDGSTFAVGRRKAAIARCFLTEGSGRITVNGRPLDEYFRFVDRRNAARPLIVTETEHFFDLRIDLFGGGTTGQAEAVKFAISRCILKYDPQYWWVLHGERLLQGDRRRVEPKKYGRHKARRGNQWVKR